MITNPSASEELFGFVTRLNVAPTLYPINLILLVEFLLLDPMASYKLPSLLVNFGIDDNCTSLVSSRLVDIVEKNASGLLLFTSNDKELNTFSFEGSSFDTTDTSLRYDAS